jgi:prolyl oligopeptidase
MTLPLDKIPCNDMMTNIQDTDPFLWLENIESSDSLKWVEEQNQHTVSILEKHPEYQNIYNNTLKQLQSDDKIPYVILRNNYVYNFWQDSTNIQGIIRRTTVEDYRNEHPAWDIVLDLDRLSRATDEKWVYKDATYIYPTHPCNRTILHLSKGGSDACFMKEFDIETKKFILDGFNLNEAKSDVTWLDIDHIFVGTDFGPGSLTRSGYPRIIKLWTRGTALENAETIFEISPDDVAVDITNFYEHGLGGNIKYTIISRMIDFYNKDFFLLHNDSLYTKTKINLPEQCNLLGLYKNQFLISLQEDWNDIVTGSVCSFDLDSREPYHINQLFAPAPKVSFEDLEILKKSVMVTTIHNITNTITEYDFIDGTWKPTGFLIPGQGSLSITGDENSNTYYVCYSDFLRPSTLYEYNGHDCMLVKKLPDCFDSSDFKVEQKEAKSKDGTMIPYFMVGRKDMRFNNSNPTILYGYGGFEVSMTPFYSGIIGNNWLNYGGVFVMANIRGGGEFGPAWHQAALTKNRMKCYEDFICIAEDLIRSGVTDSGKLGIKGQSNGGLLVSAVTMLRPDLFNAVLCSVPLLDMKRYHLLLAGNSWISEYGDPNDPDTWDYIKTYSPYHNIKQKEKYPVILFTTSTKDDRVHPGHARKMVAKMQGMNHQVLYFENQEGEHAGAADHIQTAKITALEYAHMLSRLQGTEKNLKRKIPTTAIKSAKYVKI